MSNEPDRDKRRALEETRVRLLDENLNPVYLDAAQIDREAVQQLGVPNYYELYTRFGFKLDSLADECRELLDETEKLWEREGDRLFRSRLGIGLSEARAWDVVRLFRAPELDQLYPSDRMVPALEATLTDLGVDLRSQSNVHLDLETRPSKTPRAFCAPIEVPGKVMLVIQPIGGKDDWEALFHEAGHTEHYAHTNGDLTMEAKRLGDMAVTEGWAMLMQHLVTEPAWLNRRLDVPRPADLAYDGAVSLLYFVRRYCAKLLYELEFFQADDLLTMRGRYHEILSDALKLPVNPESYLDDIDGSFYVIGYLRSLGVRGAAARVPARRVRQRVVRPAGCRRPAARALVAGAGPDGRRAAQGRHGREARDGRRRRSGARGSRRLTLAPDDQLIVSMARGAEDALAELYDRFGGVAYGVALRILRDPALAQDAVQDAFLAAWRTAAVVRPGARERVDVAADTRAPPRRRPRAPRGAAPR